MPEYIYIQERKTVINVREMLAWIRELDHVRSHRVQRITKEMRGALDAGLDNGEPKELRVTL